MFPSLQAGSIFYVGVRTATNPRSAQEPRSRYATDRNGSEKNSVGFTDRWKPPKTPMIAVQMIIRTKYLLKIFYFPLAANIYMDAIRGFSLSDIYNYLVSFWVLFLSGCSGLLNYILNLNVSGFASPAFPLTITLSFALAILFLNIMLQSVCLVGILSGVVEIFHFVFKLFFNLKQPCLCFDFMKIKK